MKIVTSPEFMIYVVHPKEKELDRNGLAWLVPYAGASLAD